MSGESGGGRDTSCASVLYVDNRRGRWGEDDGISSKDGGTSDSPTRLLALSLIDPRGVIRIGHREFVGNVSPGPRVRT